MADDNQNNLSDIHVLRQVLAPRSIAKVLLKYCDVLRNNLSFSNGDGDLLHNDEDFNYKLGCNSCHNGCEPSETSCENLEIKLASWRTAFYIACLFLKIDLEIIRTEG